MAHVSRDIFLEKLAKAKELVEIGGVYVHAKTGGRYRVTNLVIREENEEVRVIYEELDHSPAIIWDRSLDGESGWLIPVEIDGKKIERFRKV